MAEIAGRAYVSEMVGGIHREAVPVAVTAGMLPKLAPDVGLSRSTRS